MSWPTPQDYHEAIQNPHQNLIDAELREGVVELNTFGLPKVASGNFASVYKMRCRDRFVAVRCFLHDVSDQALRYEKITGFVMADDLPYTVGFQYLNKGILVKSKWFPVLKMDWVDGKPLDQYVKAHHADSARMASLAEKFKTMILDLKRAGIAHGDLQHGNILVINDGAELRLVDYDGMFVPALAGSYSNEIGHRNYQHPQRSSHHFGGDLDNFSVWSIYTSLGCISIDPTLVRQLRGCDECLLFRYDDYKAPLHSPTFAILEKHSRPEVRSLARKFRARLARDVEDRMFPAEEEESLLELPPLIPQQRFSVNINLPEWLRESGHFAEIALDAEALEAPPQTKPNAPNPVQTEAIPKTDPGYWPNLNDYLDAMTDPSLALSRFPDLKDAGVPNIGETVKHLVCGNTVMFPIFAHDCAFALQVFLKPDSLRSRRYAEVLPALETATKQLQKFLVPVEYFEAGIQVKGNWYPALKMPWVGGVTLRQLMRSKVAPVLFECSLDLRNLMNALTDNGLVHGDIEPGNIIVAGEQLKLFHYETMHLKRSPPASDAEPNRDYAHPKSHKVSDPGDNFSAWLLDTSLLLLAREPDIHEYLKPSGDLFTEYELQHRDQSAVFQRMKTLGWEHGALLDLFLQDSPELIPPLVADGSIDLDYLEKARSQRGLHYAGKLFNLDVVNYAPGRGNSGQPFGSRVVPDGARLNQYPSSFGDPDDKSLTQIQDGLFLAAKKGNMVLTADTALFIILIFLFFVFMVTFAVAR